MNTDKKVKDFWMVSELIRTFSEPYKSVFICVHPWLI